MAKTIEDFLTPEIKKWFEMFSEGIVVLDKDIRVIYANESHIKRSPIPREQLIGMHLPTVRPWAVAPEVFRTQKAMRGVMHTIEENPSYCDVIPYMDEGRMIGALVVVRNNTLMDDLYKKIGGYKERITQLNNAMRGLFKAEYHFEDVFGQHDYIEVAKKAASANSPVLIVGESGTGKEVIAQSIHNASQNSSMPFVDVNCASLPEQLLESELFGYAPGAFTGALKSGKMGLFEMANSGTLFLDEIAEMPIGLQSKLLRVLQEGKIRRVGDTKNIAINVRIIAATNQKLDLLIQRNKFRSDLFYRLAVFVINIPPLRERKEEIRPLCEHFIAEKYAGSPNRPTISERAWQILEDYDWPGNIRQLKNAIEYSCEVARDNIIDSHDLPAYILKKPSYFPQGFNKSEYANQTLEETIDSVEREVIKECIAKFGNSVEGKIKIAKVLGISIATLYNKIRKHNIND